MFFLFPDDHSGGKCCETEHEMESTLFPFTNRFLCHYSPLISPESWCMNRHNETLSGYQVQVDWPVSPCKPDCFPPPQGHAGKLKHLKASPVRLALGGNWSDKWQGQSVQQNLLLQMDAHFPVWINALWLFQIHNWQLPFTQNWDLRRYILTKKNLERIAANLAAQWWKIVFKFTDVKWFVHARAVRCNKNKSHRNKARLKKAFTRKAFWTAQLCRLMEKWTCVNLRHCKTQIALQTCRLHFPFQEQDDNFCSSDGFEFNRNWIALLFVDCRNVSPELSERAMELSLQSQKHELSTFLPLNVFEKVMPGSMVINYARHDHQITTP